MPPSTMSAEEPSPTSLPVPSEPGTTALELSGRTAIITGGGRGIGRAIAELYLEAGAKVVLADADESIAAETAEDLRRIGEVEALALDVRNWDAVNQLFEYVEKRHGRVDVCVNNAGIQAVAPSLDMARETWQRVLDVNLTGVFACAQAAARIMAKSEGGVIVNMASAAGTTGMPGRAPYCASKAAVIVLTKVLASEWAQHRIRVNAIGPGWVETDMVKEAIHKGTLSTEKIRQRTPMDRLGHPREVAQVALFLASDRSSYITGQTIFPDGGFTAFGLCR